MKRRAPTLRDLGTLNESHGLSSIGSYKQDPSLRVPSGHTKMNAFYNDNPHLFLEQLPVIWKNMPTAKLHCKLSIPNNKTVFGPPVSAGSNSLSKLAHNSKVRSAHCRYRGKSESTRKMPAGPKLLVSTKGRSDRMSTLKDVKLERLLWNGHLWLGKCLTQCQCRAGADNAFANNANIHCCLL